MTKGRSTVYNNIVTPEKLSQVNPENIQLGKDFLEYLSSVDRSKTTIDAYANDLKIFWVWLLENCNNKFFTWERIGNRLCHYIAKGLRHVIYVATAPLFRSLCYL